MVAELHMGKESLEQGKPGKVLIPSLKVTDF